MIVAGILLTAPVGCQSTSAVSKKMSVDIGPAPSYLSPKKLPTPKAGDYVYTDAATARSAHTSREIEKCAARYEWNHVRAQLKDGKTPTRLSGVPEHCKTKGGNPFPKPIK